MDMNTVIEINGIKKTYKKRVLFDNVTLNIEQGSTVGLVGENGSGKSVFYKIIAGFVKPDCGYVKINGKIVGEKQSFPDDVGILINTPGYIGKYSGFENLMFLANIQNKIDKEDVKATMKKVGLDYTDSTRVDVYSIGMKQKLGIAQAIMEDQKIIILDEPFNGLDYKTKNDIVDIIKLLKKEGKTVLLTSHNFDDINQLCDQIFLLSDQQINLISDEMLKKYLS